MMTSPQRDRSSRVISTLISVQTLLIALSGGLFTVYILVYASAARMATDDFMVACVLRDYGVLGGIAHFRATWCGRWLMQVVELLFVKMTMRDGRLLMPIVSGLALLISGTWVLVRTASKRLSGVPIPRLRGLSMAVFLVANSFFSLSYPGEVWAWLNGVANYLLPLGLFVLGGGLILSERPRTAWLAAVVFGLLAGFSEQATVATVALLGSVVAASAASAALRGLSVAAFFRSDVIKRALLSLACCTAVAAVNLSAPGNYIRLGVRHAPIYWGNIPWQSARMTWILLRHRTLWLVLAAAAGIVAGQEVSQVAGHWSRLQSLRGLAWLICGYCLVNTASVALPAMVFESPPPRCFLFSCFIAILTSSGAGYVVTRGRLLPDGWRTALGVLTVGVLTVGAFQISLTFVRQYPIMRAYAAGYDGQFARFREVARSGQTEELLVPELPPAGLLLDANPTSDTKHWINQVMASAMGLHCEVRRATKD